MSLLKSLLDAFREGQDPIVLPDAITFTAIDAAAIEAQLELKRKAEEFGAKNYPPKDQIPPDAVESELSREVTLRLRPVQDLYIENQKAYAARLATLEPLTLASQVKGKVASQKAAIAVALADAENHMYSASQRLEDAQRKYRDLKAKYGGIADPIDQGKPWWKKILLVVAFILIEGVVNGASIQAYMSGGWGEALMVTAGIPFMTVGLLAWITGSGLQNSARPGKEKYKPIMWTVAVLFGLIAILANLYISSFRMAGTKSLGALNDITFDGKTPSSEMPDIGELATQIWLGVFNGNFQQFDAIAIVMFFMATAFFGISVYKFYHFSHQYPDFVEAYIFWNRAVNEHQKKTTDLRTKFEDFKNITDEFNQVYNLLQAWAIEHSQIIDSQTVLYNKFLAYQSHCKETLEVLVRKYRSWNLAARQDLTTVPIYFREEIKNTDIREPSPVGRADTAEEYSERLLQANIEIQNSQAEISRQIEQFSKIVQPIARVGG